MHEVKEPGKRVHVALQEAETSRQNRCLALDVEKML